MRICPCANSYGPVIILRRFNESTSKCPKLDNLFSAKYWFNLRDRKRHVMAAKTQKYFCYSCVRLLVHRFTFSMLYENIRVNNVVDRIFFQILFVW